MNLDDFFAALDRFGDDVPLPELTRLMRKLDITLDDVASHVHFSDECYQRNLLREGAGYQALILCWKVGQKSPIHDHRGSSCGVRVLAGEVVEQVFNRDAEGRLSLGPRHELATGQVCGSYDADIHELINPSPDVDLVTMHIYAPALVTMGVYQRDSTEVVDWTAPAAV